jgi:hypothetical protein
VTTPFRPFSLSSMGRMSSWRGKVGWSNQVKKQ